ncbi:MAG: hypothetical protein U0703_11660 [Anaerolineae bacterium]
MSSRFDSPPSSGAAAFAESALTGVVVDGVSDEAGDDEAGYKQLAQGDQNWGRSLGP